MHATHHRMVLQGLAVVALLCVCTGVAWGQHNINWHQVVGAYHNAGTNELIKTAQDGWGNSRAISLNTLNPDSAAGHFEFTVRDSGGVEAGVEVKGTYCASALCVPLGISRASGATTVYIYLDSVVVDSVTSLGVDVQYRFDFSGCSTRVFVNNNLEYSTGSLSCSADYQLFVAQFDENGVIEEGTSSALHSNIVHPITWTAYDGLQHTFLTRTLACTGGGPHEAFSEVYDSRRERYSQSTVTNTRSYYFGLVQPGDTLDTTALRSCAFRFSESTLQVYVEGTVRAEVNNVETGDYFSIRMLNDDVQFYFRGASVYDTVQPDLDVYRVFFQTGSGCEGSSFERFFSSVPPRGHVYYSGYSDSAYDAVWDYALCNASTGSSPAPQGAFSKNRLAAFATGELWLRYTAANDQTAFGFSRSDGGFDTDSIEVGVLFESGQLRAIENGSVQATVSVNTGDFVRIWRNSEDGVVIYLNESEVHSAILSSSHVLYADVSLQQQISCLSDLRATFYPSAYVHALEVQPWEQGTDGAQRIDGAQYNTAEGYLVTQWDSLYHLGDTYYDSLEAAYKLVVDSIFQETGNPQPAAQMLYLPFDGNANDASGNGHNATVSGPVLTTDRFGNANQAYYFDGVNDQMVITDHPDLDVTTDFTISAWIKPDEGFGSFVNGVVQIISKWGAGGVGNAAYLLGIRQTTEKLATYTYNGSRGTFGQSNTTILAGQWTFVAMTMSNQELRVYYNGQLDQSYTNARIPQNSNYNLRLGTEASGLLNSYYAGILDEVRIYNQALSAEEIGLLFTGANPYQQYAHNDYLRTIQPELDRPIPGEHTVRLYDTTDVVIDSITVFQTAGPRVDSLSGVSLSGTELTKTGATGWTSGLAVSSNQLYPGLTGSYRFYLPETGEYVLGLRASSTAPGQNLNSVDLGVYATAGTFRAVQESSLAGPTIALNERDEFMLERTNDEVRLVRNGQTIRSITADLSQWLVLDIKIRDNGGKISLPRTELPYWPVWATEAENWDCGRKSVQFSQTTAQQFGDDYFYSSDPVVFHWITLAGDTIHTGSTPSLSNVQTGIYYQDVCISPLHYNGYCRRSVIAVGHQASWIMERAAESYSTEDNSIRNITQNNHPSNTAQFRYADAETTNQLLQNNDGWFYFQVPRPLPTISSVERGPLSGTVFSGNFQGWNSGGGGGFNIVKATINWPMPIVSRLQWENNQGQRTAFTQVQPLYYRTNGGDTRLWIDTDLDNSVANNRFTVSSGDKVYAIRENGNTKLYVNQNQRGVTSSLGTGGGVLSQDNYTTTLDFWSRRTFTLASPVKFGFENVLTSFPCATPYYCKLFPVLDGDYYHTNSNLLYFQYEARYTNDSLDYRVVRDDNRTDVTHLVTLDRLTRTYGDNRYQLNATGLQDGYYRLRIVGEKGTLSYLRFYNKY